MRLDGAPIPSGARAVPAPGVGRSGADRAVACSAMDAAAADGGRGARPGCRRLARTADAGRAPHAQPLPGRRHRIVVRSIAPPTSAAAALGRPREGEDRHRRCQRSVAGGAGAGRRPGAGVCRRVSNLPASFDQIGATLKMRHACIVRAWPCRSCSVVMLRTTRARCANWLAMQWPTVCPGPTVWPG